MSSRYTRILAAVAACVAGLTAGCTSAEKATNEPRPTFSTADAALPATHPATGTPIKIGYMNLEGGKVISAPQYRQGAELAVDYVNHYLNGFGGHPVHLVRCDMDGTPASSTACANTMVDQKVPLVIQGVDTNTTGIPILAKAGIPYVIPNANGPAEASTPGVFSMVSNAGPAIGAGALYAKSQGWDQVGFVALNTPNISQFVRQFAGPMFTKAAVGLTTIYQDPGTPDLTPQVSAAMSKNPQGLIYYGDVNGGAAFLKAAGALGVTVPKILVGGAADPSVLSIVSGAALQNTYVASGVDLGGEGADTRTFEALVHKDLPTGQVHSIRLRLGYLPVVTLARIFANYTGSFTAPEVASAIRAAKDVPLVFGDGLTLTCNGSVIPSLPSVCSDGGVLMKVAGPTDFQFVKVFRTARLFGG